MKYGRVKNFREMYKHELKEEIIKTYSLHKEAFLEPDLSRIGSYLEMLNKEWKLRNYKGDPR